jgi:branched-chain amino acid transport system ATP-binding protein
MLSVQDVHVRFGHAHILQGVSLETGTAPFAVVGRNGMGKTTLCYTIAALIHPSEGVISLGEGRIDGLRPNQVARAGIAIVPQGRRVFPSLNVDEHLRLIGRRPDAAWTIERVYDTFPRLAERRQNRGGQLSGGEQQMLAISRALLMNPRLVIMDEPSEGLAPIIVEHLISVLCGLGEDGIALFLVEQNLRVAAAIADSIAVMVTGRIAATIPSKELVADRDLQQRFLGVGSARDPASTTLHQRQESIQ